MCTATFPPRHAAAHTAPSRLAALRTPPRAAAAGSGTTSTAPPRWVPALWTAQSSLLPSLAPSASSTWCGHGRAVGGRGQWGCRHPWLRSLACTKHARGPACTRPAAVGGRTHAGGGSAPRRRLHRHTAQAAAGMAPLPAALLLALAGAPCVRAWRLRPQLTAAHRTCRHPSRAPPPVPQHAREEKLGVMLGALLRRYVEGDAAGFSESMSAEAASLATASFGDLMLDAIGRVYKAQADIFLGGAWDGSLAALRCSGWCCEGRQAAPAPRGPARLCWGPACTPHHLQISHRAGCPVPQGQGGGHQGAVFGGQPGAEGLQEAA